MANPGLSIVLRILDNENRLSERADQKSISMLSIIGVFMVFFIVYYRVIPTNALTVILIVLYFICALTAIINLIMAIRPRIRKQPGESGIATARDPAFFTGISEFPSINAYKDSLEKTLQDDSSVMDVYIRQIYSVARINREKYKFVQRGVVMAIVTLIIELVIITYLFTYYMGEGATKMPPI